MIALMPQLLCLLGFVGMMVTCCLTHIRSYTQISLGILSLVLVTLWMVPQGSFWGIWHVDLMSNIMQSVCIILSMCIIAYTAKGYNEEKFLYVCLLILIALLGCFTILSTQSMVLMYIGLELLALPTYALCGLDKEKGHGSEAALKYFVMGAVASIFILYGMSFIYAATGGMQYVDIAKWVSSNDPAMLFYMNLGIVFLLAGFCFKLGAAPFHMWVPDVYQSAPLGVVFWLSVVPKVAIAGMLARFIMITNISELLVWQQIIGFVSIFSIVYGVLLAMRQTNIRRLIGYASIVHMGFILLPLQFADGSGVMASSVYVLGYVIMTLAAFTSVYIFASKGRNQVEDLEGVARCMPITALIFMLALAAMAGIPPFVGFIIKLNVLSILIKQGLYSLAVIAVLAVAAGAYYYMRFIRMMYFSEGKMQRVTEHRLLLCLPVLLILMGVFPQGYMVVLNQAVEEVQGYDKG